MKKRQLVVKRAIPSSVSLRRVRYVECKKNHAASVGGYAVDGCREFMPCADEGSDAALVCAACGCHRNFHRREADNDAVSESSSSPTSNGHQSK